MHLEAKCTRMIPVPHFSDVAYSGINFTSITMATVGTGLWKCDSHDDHEELNPFFMDNVALEAHSADISDATLQEKMTALTQSESHKLQHIPVPTIWMKTNGANVLTYVTVFA